MAGVPFALQSMKKGKVMMAVNKSTGNNHRKGTVRNRSQFQYPSGYRYERDANMGEILDVSSSSDKLKCVRREK